MTHRDTTMLERAADAGRQQLYSFMAKTSDWDELSEGEKQRWTNVARAILNELKHPSEGMVEAGQSTGLVKRPGDALLVFFVMIQRALDELALDHVLNEGEG